MLFYLQNTTFSYPESSYYAFFPYFFTRFSCKKLLISSFSLNISLPLPFIPLSFILTHVVYIIRCQDRVSLLFTYNFCKSSYLSFSPDLRVDNENSHLFHKINPSVSSFLTTVWRDCFLALCSSAKSLISVLDSLPYQCRMKKSISCISSPSVALLLYMPLLFAAVVRSFCMICIVFIGVYSLMALMYSRAAHPDLSPSHEASSSSLFRLGQ